MQRFLNDEEKHWLKTTFQKFDTKMQKECERLGNKIPYIPENGHYVDDMAEKDIGWWTNGFWGGIMWQMYHATGTEIYRDKAENVEVLLDQCLQEFTGLHHDVGFMWMHTAVANYRLTKNNKSFARGMHAANILAGRFNVLGNFIRAWNGDRTGWMIIDCLMNLSILYWATEETKDPRFAAIAVRHADTALEKLLRPDGSSNHIAILNADNGEVLETPAGQGFADGSSWSRGQSWAIYGFAISYAHTKENRYLDAAKQVSHYFMANVALTNYLPLCDFRSPEEPIYYDSTAGACAACGLLEIAKHVSEYEKALYVKSALKILQAMDEHFCNWNEDEDGILGMGRAAYHNNREDSHVPIIYGDYFYLEALLRLMDKDFWIW
ncbi:MAG: glycoside hydrolase family 88 protein [Lachnospiraceae bacterium]